MPIHVFVGDNAQLNAQAFLLEHPFAHGISLKDKIVAMATMLGMTKTSEFSEAILRKIGHHPALKMISYRDTEIKVVYDVPDALTLRLIKSAFDPIIVGEESADLDTPVVGAEKVEIANVAKFLRLISEHYNYKYHDDLALFGLNYARNVFALVVTDKEVSCNTLRKNIAELRKELSTTKTKLFRLQEKNKRDQAPTSLKEMISNVKPSL